MYSLTTTLVRFEEHYVILHNEHIGEFRWPIKNIPDGVKVGETVTLRLETSKVQEEEKYERMRKLLEELIN